MVVIALLSLILTVISGFRITFNPTDKLIELSSIPDATLSNLIAYSFRNEPFWPILSAFKQARLYNFTPVFSSVLGFFQCSEIFDVILREEFPVKKVFDADTLNFDIGLIECFSRLPVEFFRDRLQINPMESKDFKTGHWGFGKSFEFLKMAFINPDMAINWYVWSSSTKFIPSGGFGGLTRFPNSSWSWIWKTISFVSIHSLPESLNLNLIKIISHRYDIEAEYFYRNDRNIPIRFSGILRWSNLQFDEEEIDFSRYQIMKIITISVFAFSYPAGNEVHQRSRAFLMNSLAVFKNGKRKFPLRKELKMFIRNVIAFNDQERDEIASIQLLLISFAKHLKGIALGPWLLNIIFIWTHFNDGNRSSIKDFLGPFTDVFFAPETFIMPSDICLLLEVLNSFLLSDSHIAQLIIKTQRLSQAKAVYKECPSEIPKLLQRDSKIFPLSFRIERLFIESRFISELTSFPLNILLKAAPPEQVCLSIFHVVNSRLDYLEVLPMNSKIITSKLFHYGNLRGMLELFFQSLMHSASWFEADLGDWRPVLRPSLTFPPHLMECIGVLLAQAVVSNVEVPFLLDKKYFFLSNAFDLLQEPRHPISSRLQEAYPEILEGKYTKCRKVHRILSTLHFTSTRILEKLQNRLTDRGIVDLEPIDSEPSDISNSAYDLNRIVLMGAERLRFGMNLVILADSLKPKHLYKLIFKQ